MAVFTAFSDESASGEARGDFFLGGYVASEAAWPQIAGSWQSVLNGPPGIPYIHMREIRNAKWQADNNISPEQAEDCIEAACSLLGKITDIAAIVAKINLGDHSEIFIRQYAKRKHVPLGLREPDYFCFVAYAAFIAAHVHQKWPEAEKIDGSAQESDNLPEKPAF
jgi:hypothetical protein